MSIELRFSNVEPPASEPKRTVYADVVNLPSPVYLGLTVIMYNYDNVSLYMRCEGAGTGWTFTPVNHGVCTSGSNIRRNMDNFGYRTRPSSETSETITVTLKAYTDAGYTNLKWTFERTVDVVFIKSDDGTWTTDVNNNFDDGTFQGWNVANILDNGAGYPKIAIRTDYVLSTPYSVRMEQQIASGKSYAQAKLYKSIAMPNKNKVYVIADVRFGRTSSARIQWVQLVKDSDILVYLGHQQFDADNVPIDKWIRTIAPYPKNVTVEVALHQRVTQVAGAQLEWLWMDDFRVISKD